MLNPQIYTFHNIAAFVRKNRVKLKITIFSYTYSEPSSILSQLLLLFLLFYPQCNGYKILNNILFYVIPKC